MGLLSGSISFRAYRVFGKLSDSPKEELLALANRHAFRGFSDDTDSKATGLVECEEMLRTEISYDAFFRNNYVLFSLRKDTRSVPKTVLRAHAKDAVEAFRQKNNLETVSRLQRKEIEEVTHLKLLKEATPKIAICDVCWNLDTGLLFFFNTSNSINDDFLAIFRKTFSLEMLPLSPSTMLKEKNADDPHSDATLLGQEFLTWLLYVVSTKRTIITDKFEMDLDCWLEGGITLKGRETESSHKGGSSQASAETLISLLKGSLVSRLRIGFKYNDLEWLFTLTDAWFARASVKIPAVLTLEEDDKFYERVGHIEEIQTLLTTAYGVFLENRIDELAWQQEAAGMKAWFASVNLSDLLPAKQAA